MNAKKTPERFSIRFDSKIPEHQRVIEILSKKGRNTARYILGSISDFNPDCDMVENLEEIDRYILMRLNKLIEKVFPT